jgi:hypothetical protein
MRLAVAALASYGLHTAMVGRRQFVDGFFADE